MYEFQRRFGRAPFDGRARTHYVYERGEAEKAGLLWVEPWHQAQPLDYVLTDDDLVMQLIYRRCGRKMNTIYEFSRIMVSAYPPGGYHEEAADYRGNGFIPKLVLRPILENPDIALGEVRSWEDRVLKKGRIQPILDTLVNLYLYRQGRLTEEDMQHCADRASLADTPRRNLKYFKKLLRKEKIMNYLQRRLHAALQKKGVDIGQVLHRYIDISDAAAEEGKFREATEALNSLFDVARYADDDPGGTVEEADWEAIDEALGRKQLPTETLSAYAEADQTLAGLIPGK